MAKEKFEIIKEADITNNCPECFSQNMRITFFQKHSYDRFSHKITDDISSQVKCNTCNSTIYPVNWTEDIERIHDYYKKAAEPKNSRTIYNKFFFILVLLGIALVGALIFFFLQGGLKMFTQ